jgi:hypothetical protein
MDLLRTLNGIFRRAAASLASNCRSVDAPDNRTSVAASRRSGLEFSILGQLPPEILREISSHLSLASAASFAMSCSSMSSITGTQHRHDLRKDDQEEELREFLSLLERDLPDYISCYDCKKLHTADETRHNAQRLLPFGQAAPCLEGDPSGITGHYLHHGFSFATFQMAMKRHRLGLDCADHLRLLSFPTERYGWTILFNVTAQARIVDGRLLLRIEKQLGPPRDSCLQLICPHLVMVHFCRYSGATQLVGSAAHPALAGGGLTQCQFCLTEFQVELKQLAHGRDTIALTIWLDLGQGLTPLDPTWASRHDHRRSYEPVKFGAGSIRAQFEKDAALIS